MNNSAQSASTNEHRDAAQEVANREPIRCAILTVSDTRTEETDKGGRLIRGLLTAGDASPFQIAEKQIVKDEMSAIDSQLTSWLEDPAIHAIITTGGTGISRRDTTFEVVERKLSAKLDGFGELFRMLSWEEVQAAAMLSRATGGLACHESGHDTFVFAIPGSTNAIRLALTKLIIPELPHLIWERKR